MTQTGTMLCDNAGDSANYYGLGSGDLCIPYHRSHDNTWGYVFGDSWQGQDQNGLYLGSPCMLNQGTFDASGNTPIAFTWAMPNRTAQQLFNYNHRADNGFGYEISRIPNDAICVLDRTLIQYTSVNNWVGPNSSVDGSLMSGVAYSDDYGATWHDFGYHWQGQAQGLDGNGYHMWSFVSPVADSGNWIYIFSKRWNGSHNYANDGGYMQLFRLTWQDLYNGNWGAQENWANVGGVWQWIPTSQGAPSNMNLTTNNIGEFSVKQIGSTFVMSYLDCTDGSIKTRTAPAVTGPWSAEKIQVVSNNTWPPSHWGLPQMNTIYGGYIHPGSASATNLTLIISSWNGQLNSRPYTATQWSGLSA